MMRRRANKRRDKRYFSKTALAVNPKNVASGPMRGGYSPVVAQYNHPNRLS